VSAVRLSARSTFGRTRCSGCREFVLAGPRDYSAGTRAALVALSRGTCYFPECAEPLVRIVDGHPTINFDIAHICDANPGNRHDPTMTDDGRRHFRNLVLLCLVHHKLVDKIDPAAYPSEVLQAWKSNADPTAADRLDPISEAALKEAITQITLDVGGGVLYVGGQGGHLGGGGGGGGVIGAGRGGDGGDGGAIVVDDNTRIVLGGEGAQAPGGGGGGGGILAPGSIVRRQAPKVNAAAAARSPLGISAILLANYAEARDALVYIAGGGWEWISTLNLGDHVAIPMVALVECGGLEVGEYAITARLLNPDGACKQEIVLAFAITERAEVRRVPVFTTFEPQVDAFGTWQLTLSAADVQVGGLDFLIKRTGEA
jgi:hypothetical protein